MNPRELFDTHLHLDDEQFAADLDGVVQRAQQAGVARMIAVGTTAASSAESIRLATQFPSVFAAVGIQPNYCAEALPGDWDQVVELSKLPRVAASDQRLEAQQVQLARSLMPAHVVEWPVPAAATSTRRGRTAASPRSSRAAACRGTWNSSFTTTREISSCG